MIILDFHQLRLLTLIIIIIFFTELDNASSSSEDQGVVNLLLQKLNTINKFATGVYNNIASNTQVICVILNQLLRYKSIQSQKKSMKRSTGHVQVTLEIRSVLC